VKKGLPRYKGEQALKEELRELTEQTRRLREELNDMVSAPRSKDLTRALLHTQSWAKARRREQIPAVAQDRRRRKR
jgi:hypothetical protein